MGTRLGIGHVFSPIRERCWPDQLTRQNGSQVILDKTSILQPKIECAGGRGGTDCAGPLSPDPAPARPARPARDRGRDGQPCTCGRQSWCWTPRSHHCRSSRPISGCRGAGASPPRAARSATRSMWRTPSGRRVWNCGRSRSPCRTAMAPTGSGAPVTAGLLTGIAASPWMRAALRYGAIVLAVLLFLLAFRRSGERAGHLAGRLEPRRRSMTSNAGCWKRRLADLAFATSLLIGCAVPRPILRADHADPRF